MKSANTTMLVICLIAGMVACRHDRSHDETGESNEWPEMEAFHMTMADAYHPFKDSSDLKAAKNLAGNLADEAEAWAASKRPENLNTDELTVNLTKLKVDCRIFSNHVAAGTPDAALGSELTALHSEFHAIMEASHGESKEKEDKE